MTLLDQIDARRREIHTDGYSMSIGEVMSMYRDGDLDIHPEFQRIFRWTDEQKSRLIESILLGIPVPTIFISQRDDGIWDVIDGVQRLSTILQFVGIYKDENNVPAAPLRLMPTEYLPSLEAYTYELTPSGGPSFDEVLQRDFKRSKVDFVIVRKESDPDAKYDLFQRLNSGTELSPQEARNCLIVMLDRTFYEWIVERGDEADFTTAVPISQRKEDEGFRHELVLRFLLHRHFEGDSRELPVDFGDYLTQWVRGIATSDNFGREEEATIFRECFRVLADAVGEDAFRKWDEAKGRFVGPFSISAYEAVTSGIAEHLPHWKNQEGNVLVERLKRMWGDREFLDNSGSGVSPRRRMPKIVNYGRRAFAPPG